MMSLSMQRFFIAGAFVLSQSATAANAVRVDAKKSLAILEGDYQVIKSDSAVEKENLCVNGIVHTVKWSGSPDDLILSVGASLVVSDINAGLKTDSQPYYKHHCVYRHSNQAESTRVIIDEFSNCDDENTTAHTEILVKGAALEYSSETKISRNGKVVAIPSKCTLLKIDKVSTPIPKASPALLTK